MIGGRHHNIIDTMLKSNRLYRFAFPSSAQLPPRQDGWYGHNKLLNGKSPPSDNRTIVPFVIEVNQETLHDLRHRLESLRTSDSIDDSQFRYGFNSQTLRDIVDYWLDGYDWRKWERELNRFAQFKTQIEGIDVHFVHARLTKPSGVVQPILLIHGWPGSFFEFSKAIPHLHDCSTGGLAFDVVVPSIPGFAFSEAPHQEGFSVVSAARIFVKLMFRLGYKRFFVHGGDWGSLISKTIALMYPENIRGIHTTLHFNAEPQGNNVIRFLFARYLPMLMFRNRESERLMFDELEQLPSNWYLESGYSHIQATKPDTIGVALTDSPAGLAAYILEKFSTWTAMSNVYKNDGGFSKNKLSFDELLTNVMIYWLSNNVVSSLRFYRENLCPGKGALFKYDITAAKVSQSVPAAYAVLPNEIVRPPRFVVEMAYGNLIQYSELPRGGHFCIFEEPELVVEDLKKFVRLVISRP